MRGLKNFVVGTGRLDKFQFVTAFGCIEHHIQSKIKTQLSWPEGRIHEKWATNLPDLHPQIYLLHDSDEQGK